MPIPTILLAINDAHLRHELGDVLIAAGWKVLEAGDGQEVVELLRASTPQLLLLDLVLPRLGGGALLKRMNDEHPQVRKIPLLIVITEKTLGKDLDEAHALRPDSEFVKHDWDREHLVAKIREVLQTRTPEA